MTRSYSHCSCGTKLKIEDIRHKTYGNTETTYRRKVCPAGCETQISTLEMPMDVVIKVLGEFKEERGRNRRRYPRARVEPTCKTA